jgi:disulfide bond formation protein DsbB
MSVRSIVPMRDDPAAAAALAVALIAAATLLGAWFFQFVLKYPPCPLCLDQRLAYYVTIPLGVLLFVMARVGAPAPLVRVGLLVVLVASLANAVLATYHAGIEWHWWAGPTDCSGPLNELGGGGGLLGQIQDIHVVRCDQAAWRFLGLSLAGYNVLISLALAAIALWGLRAAGRARA